MARLRVLIVDDSAVIRRLISEALASDPSIEVASTAPNGKIALDKIEHLLPDIVTLDVEMPVMDGLETLRQIRRKWPRLPVIMFSTLTERGASTTLDALAMGASDYVAKPSNSGKLDEGLAAIRSSLIPKIKALCAHLDLAAVRVSRPSATRSLPRHVPFSGPVKILAIGVSTGGPQALEKIVPRLPAEFSVPVVIVQHMPKIFTRLLADRLSASSALPVRECLPGAALSAGQVWIAPGDFHMLLRRVNGGVVLETNQAPPENSCRPAVDVLFRSVAEVFGSSVLSVVLTGMGSDGLHGCEAIHEAGGRIFVQDEASSVVWGMPGAVANAGIADKILPLDEISGEICRYVETSRGRISGVPKARDGKETRALP
ncbi:MAG TPA: chemotaxis response regulator protein-glutamate methylesterase [Verrucomicrobiae bacterium]|nr:chemotaxis response regulator protein-glutamate methylesterase [Verrucomicrobiae bacterium]